MISNELKVIIDKLKEQGKMRFVESVTEAQIFEFEKEHTKLPLKYKEWLLFSDGGEFFLPAGIQMYGVVHKPLIDITNEDKPSKKYTVIGKTAWGDPILCENDSEKISIYNHEKGIIEKDEVYNDFFSFLNNLYSILEEDD